MTSNNAKQAVRAIMADNPGMKYTEALRLYDRAKVSKHHYDGHPDPLSIAVKIELLKAWHREHGSIDLPDSATITSDGQTFRAGEWLTKTRSQRRSGELDRWIIDQLDELGIDWGWSRNTVDIETVDPGESVTLSDPLRGTIVSGSTGSGKTVAVQGIITGAVRAGYDVAVIEMAHLGTYDGLGAEVISLGDGYEQHLIDVLSRYLHTDGGDRDRLLVIEELPALMSSPVPELRSRIEELILALVCTRRTGIVVIAQRMSGWTSDGTRARLMSNLGNRVLVGISDSQTRGMMLGRSRGVPSVKPGDPVGTAILATGGKYTKFRPARTRP